MSETLTGWVRGKTLELDSEAPELEGKHVRVSLEPIDPPAKPESAEDVPRLRSLSAELRWLDEHRSEYAGKWVALAGERLVAVAGSAREAYASARQQAILMPLVELVESEHEGASWGGWL